MNWKNILTIAKKDWIEVRRNKMVVSVMFVVPLIFIILIPLMIILIPASSPEAAQQMFQDPDLAGFMSGLPDFISEIIEGMDVTQAGIVLFLGYMFAPFFLIMPLMFASVIAAEAFAGERERKTIEPLLYTSATDTELFLGKVLAAFVPAFLITLLAFVVYIFVVNGASYSVMGRIWFPLPSWYPLIFWVSPAISVLAIAITVMISARVQTFMEAYQSSAALVVLVFGLLVGQMAGVVYLSVGVGLALGAVLWVIDAVLIRIIVRTFTRPRLLSWAD